MTGAPFDVGRVKRDLKRFRDRLRNFKWLIVFSFNLGYALECKKICDPQTNRRRRGIFSYGWASFINRDGPDLIELFSSSSSLLCLRCVIDLIDIRLVTISSGSTPFKST